MRYVFILNPKAGKGAAEQILYPRLTEYLEKSGLEWAIHRTEYRGHAEALAREEAMKGDLSELQKGIVYFSLCYCYEYGGNRELYNKYGIEGAQYALSHPGCGIRSTIRLMTLACQIETQLGNQEAAGAWLNKLESIRQGRNFLIETAQYSITAATYEMTFGILEKAYDHYQTAITQADILWEKDTSYYLILGQMAVILQRLNRFQEAVEQYQRLLNYAEESDNAHLLNICRRWALSDSSA